MEIVTEVYFISNSIPENEKFNLISQIRRSAVSIPSNIAEGCSRSSDKEFKRFLEIAQGSAFELETQLLIAEKLEYCSDINLKKINILKASINALINKLK